MRGQRERMMGGNCILKELYLRREITRENRHTEADGDTGLANAAHGRSPSIWPSQPARAARLGDHHRDDDPIAHRPSPDSPFQMRHGQIPPARLAASSTKPPPVHPKSTPMAHVPPLVAEPAKYSLSVVASTTARAPSRTSPAWRKNVVIITTLSWLNPPSVEIVTRDIRGD